MFQDTGITDELGRSVVSQSNSDHVSRKLHCITKGPSSLDDTQFYIWLNCSCFVKDVQNPQITSIT